MKTVRDGGIISLNAENIGCGGGKFYTGFTEMPEHVPTFVSLKEKYKQTGTGYRLHRTNGRFQN